MATEPGAEQAADAAVDLGLDERQKRELVRLLGAGPFVQKPHLWPEAADRRAERVSGAPPTVEWVIWIEAG